MKTLAVMTFSALLGGCLIDTTGATGADDTDEATDAIVARLCGTHNCLANNMPVVDDTGAFATVSSQGFVDLDNEFFQDLGSNGRRCVSCHVPASGWTITPRLLASTFDQTSGGTLDDGSGLGAIFRTVDGANAPNADVSTLAKRRSAYSMLLDRGLIRIGLAVPANAEFTLIAVDDPYHFASAAQLSLFRRPLPTTNLQFASTVMWDGREVVIGATVPAEFTTQASDAVVGHAQGRPISAVQRAAIVQFETSLATAQVFDHDAQALHDGGATGGPDQVMSETFYIGINDNFGDSRTGAAFSPIVFSLFGAWDSAAGTVAEARRAVARGQTLFNTKPIAISGVSGINDEAVFGNPTTLVGTCSTCHDSPNGGSHSVVAPLDLGLVDASRRTPDMPLYTLRNKTTGKTRQVTDPGRAMIDGKWNHIGRFKGPMLRDLAPRAPYFHNGFAADLDAVVDFYNTRFHIGFTTQEKSDLVAFLRSL